MFPFGGSSDPKKMQEMLRRMGIKNQEVEASEVVITQKNGKRIVIKNPQVMEVEVSGQKTFQIVGEVSVQEGKGSAGLGARGRGHGTQGSGHGAGDAGHGEGEEEIEVSDKDVKFVADTTQMPEKKAREVLIKTRGDIAKAILILKK
ncbi:MAG TPA: hypothetical protein HA282_04560 [Nanoarchaeota archaeon]|nr:hypothetical protein [Candidatus Pacearchaeota archaeon]HIH17757.1 hypothetical protein [Nanoarchaeota archaeon]HIH33782.1 hypothetical protein [Nanoarchaeota archaeon]HIH50806.1 hypothetical protein [Nanoarchaeota archaeon]HIH66456.1 hypothetical protein [Nanoarchaeota archaeon]